MEFDKEGKLILKSLKRIIKHEERSFDDDDMFDGVLEVNYEKD